MRRHDLTGACFSALRVLGPAANRGRKTAWRCACACGRETVATSTNLLRAHTTSCGCKGAVYTRHGHFGSPTYKAWAGAKARCNNPRDTAYRYYGARGIRMCEAWASDFVNFLRDMGERPSAAHSLDRIDCLRDYEPGNCRWATQLEQVRNTRVSCRWFVDGIVFEARSDAAKHFGVSDATIQLWCDGARNGCHKERVYA